MRINVVKHVEVDTDAPTATNDDLIDHEKDAKKNLIICPCCGVLFDPKRDEVQLMSFSRRYKRSNRTVYDGGSHKRKQSEGQEARRGDWREENHLFWSEKRLGLHAS